MVRYISPIDSHVHLRGEEYETNFAKLGFRDARAVGICGLIEQPNTKPELISLLAVKQRRKQIVKFVGNIRHKIHIGLTQDLEQVKTALELVTQQRHGLVSDKTYYVNSTGNMGILNPNLQRKIWMLKGEMKYNGVSVGHFENESAFADIKFDPLNPVTHSLIRTEESELFSVQTQYRNAIDAKFQGIFYIAHASSPLTVEFIEEEKRKGTPFQVVIEVTPHHLFLNSNEDYSIHGNGVKMNPPLRPKKSQERLLEYAIDGNIDVIASDHAPHPLERKISSSPPSGIPVILIVPKAVELLRFHGMPEQTLEAMLFHNANRIFRMNLEPVFVDVKYNPDLWNVYGYNPFSRIDGTISSL